MDEHLGGSYLLIFLAVGLILTLIGLLILNHEMNYEIAKKYTSKTIP